ncbi:hypothetical protein F5880DRAFT_1678791 [Lentinula raphanica]|nr:hypothetical protein F5880DRAFT_1678791 [Lentinula raphanica]
MHQMMQTVQAQLKLVALGRCFASGAEGHPEAAEGTTLADADEWELVLKLKWVLLQLWVDGEERAGPGPEAEVDTGQMKCNTSDMGSSASENEDADAEGVKGPAEDVAETKHSLGRSVKSKDHYYQRSVKENTNVDFHPSVIAFSHEDAWREEEVNLNGVMEKEYGEMMLYVLDGFLCMESRFAVGAIPIEPASAAARLERMSACRFVDRMVSSKRGLRTILTVIASTAGTNDIHAVINFESDLGDYIWIVFCNFFDNFIPHHHTISL